MGTKFGRNIKDYRKLHEIKQESLAEAVGCSGAHIAHIESGKSIPSLKIAFRIAQALGTSLDLLLRDDYQEQADTYVELVKRLESYSQNEQELLCKFFLECLELLTEYDLKRKKLK